MKKLSCLNQERNRIETDQALFTSKSSQNQFLMVYVEIRLQHGIGFFTRGSIIMDYGIVIWSQWFKVKKSYCLPCFFYKHAALYFTIYSFDGLELLVHHCDVFTSYLNSYSDGTHSHW